MLDWLYELLGTMLSWFSSLFGGKYVFGLLLYALLFKLLFLPFSIKQQKNSAKNIQMTLVVSKQQPIMGTVLPLQLQLTPRNKH